MSVINESEWMPAEIVEVGKWQKYLIWLILFQVVSIILFFVLAVGPTSSAGDILELMIMIARIVLGVFSLYCVYKMAVSLKKGTPVLYAATMFLPLICLLVLASLSAGATRILQNYGIRVGVMGADQADIERLNVGSMPPSM